LLKLSKIINVNESGDIEIKFEYKYIFHNKELCQGELLKGVLSELLKDSELFNIFSPEYISYDVVYKRIHIDFSAFGLKYANLRTLLIDFGFCEPHPYFPTKKLIICHEWKKFFDKNFVPEIRKRKMSLEELRKILEHQQTNGAEAEEFVLEFEKRRLNNKEGVQQVSFDDAGLGYDILSFNTTDSVTEDRFIEVKSYSGLKPYFFWSKNEVSVAGRNRDKYYIYLVDRSEFNNKDYEPEIISNPVKNILDNDEWSVEIDKYHITKK
jgi:hypothetical protein